MSVVSDRCAEFKSACRLARKRLGAEAQSTSNGGGGSRPPARPAVALNSSLAARQSVAIGAKLGEIDGRLASLRAASERKSDGGDPKAFERAAAAVERDCAWADGAIAALAEAAAAKRGNRRDHERAIGNELRRRLGERVARVQSCALARQRTLKQQQKRRNRFAHAGPAISTRVQLDTPLFSTAFVPKAPPARPGAAPPPPPPPPARAAAFAPPATLAPSATFAPSGLRSRRGSAGGGGGAAAAADAPTRLQLQQEAQKQQMMLEQTSRRRLDRAHNIEKEIGKLGEVFSRFASLVARQAEVVERLDDDVEGALDDVEAGHAEILRAQEILRGNRALFMKVFGILIFLIVAFVYF